MAGAGLAVVVALVGLLGVLRLKRWAEVEPFVAALRDVYDLIMVGHREALRRAGTRP